MEDNSCGTADRGKRADEPQILFSGRSRNLYEHSVPAEVQCIGIPVYNHYGSGSRSKSNRIRVTYPAGNQMGQ